MKTKKIGGGGQSPPGKNQNRNRFVFLSFEVNPLNWRSFIEIGEMACSRTARCSRGQTLKTKIQAKKRTLESEKKKVGPKRHLHLLGAGKKLRRSGDEL